MGEKRVKTRDKIISRTFAAALEGQVLRKRGAELLSKPEQNAETKNAELIRWKLPPDPKKDKKLIYGMVLFGSGDVGHQAQPAKRGENENASACK